MKVWQKNMKQVEAKEEENLADGNLNLEDPIEKQDPLENKQARSSRRK